jgi:uncharacterized protein YeaO (DUF488 family)
MVKIKHLMDAVEPQDGQRLWIEPVGLTRDLREWCCVHHVLSHLGPPPDLCEWFEQHPDGYEYFRGRYHEFLSASPYRPALQHMARAMAHEDFTLLHQGTDPAQNSAVALYEFLSELSAYCPPE